MTAGAQPPPWLTSLNALGRREWISLEEGDLLDAAAARTGFADFGDDAFREPLRVLLDSIAREDALHFVGRVLARDEISTLLENRLLMSEARKRHPVIDEVEVGRPIFITGLPRTGTSILHELFACDPANRAPLAWEVKRPCGAPDDPGANADRRIASCERSLRIWNEIVAEYPTIHELGARIPVECILLTAHEFRSDQLTATNHALAYGAWLATADMQPAYRGHRRILQHLGFRCPHRRWVLKAPSHLASLDALLSVYPDARIVQTHRDPLRVMASVLSTLEATARVRCERVNIDALRAWFSGEACAALLEGASRARAGAAAKAACFVDVSYSDLVRGPLAAVAGVYERLGLELSQSAKAAMAAYLEKKPKDKHGTHDYGFDETGFDRDVERRRFEEYMRRYAVPAE